MPFPRRADDARHALYCIMDADADDSAGMTRCGVSPPPPPKLFQNGTKCGVNGAFRGTPCGVTVAIDAAVCRLSTACPPKLRVWLLPDGG